MLSDFSHQDRIPVPTADDPWWPTVNEFALSFNAYERVGTFTNVSNFGNKWAETFAADGRLPKTIDQIRTCLFFEQRRWRHYDVDAYQDPDAKRYIQALLERLTDLTGGFVEGPGDPLP